MRNKSKRPVHYYNSYTPNSLRRGRSNPTIPGNSSYLGMLNKHKKFMGIFVVVISLFAVVFLVAVIYSKDALAPVQEAQEKTETTPKKEYKTINEVQLKADIGQILSNNSDLDIGVSIIDVRTAKQYTYGVDVPFIAASVGKILSACLLLDQVESGKYSLEQQIGNNTARVQIQKMIGQSDNEAWHAINDELGHPALQEYAASVGVQNYDADKNTVTPSSVAVLLNKLYSEQLLNQDNTSFLLANMQTDLEEIQFIRKYIDPATSVYHKAGWLDDRAHDTAIIENGDRPYVLVIFTKKRFGDYDFTVGQKIFEELTIKTDTVLKAVL